jgi:hypothetical protein
MDSGHQRVHVVPRAVRLPVEVHPADLGGHDERITSSPQRSTQQLLRVATPVDVGVVEEVDARLQCRLDRLEILLESRMLRPCRGS